MCGALNISVPWGETARWFTGRVLGMRSEHVSAVWRSRHRFLWWTNKEWQQDIRPIWGFCWWLRRSSPNRVSSSSSLSSFNQSAVPFNCTPFILCFSFPTLLTISSVCDNAAHGDGSGKSQMCTRSEPATTLFPPLLPFCALLFTSCERGSRKESCSFNLQGAQRNVKSKPVLSSANAEARWMFGNRQLFSLKQTTSSILWSTSLWSQNLKHGTVHCEFRCKQPDCSSDTPTSTFKCNKWLYYQLIETNQPKVCQHQTEHV